MTFKKPSLWIAAAVWLYLILCMSLIRPLPILSGNLVESDDYMRMVRVYDLLDGQTAHNYIQPRLGPAGGSGVAWSPLIDAPLAAVTGFFDLFMIRDHAAVATATILPPLYLLLFISIAVWFVRQGSDDKTAHWAPISLLLLWGMLTQFFPGRVDHHGVQLIVLLAAFGCLIRLYRTPQARRFAVLSGALMGLSWSIGAEAVPWVALGASVTGLFWLLRGDRNFAVNGFIFGVALVAATVILTPLTRGFSGFFVAECDGISRVYLAFGAAVPLFWAGVLALPQKTTNRLAGRFISGALWAGLLGAGLYALYPHCFTDPYSVVDPELRRIWLTQVNEARSAWDYRDRPGIVVFYFLPLLAALGTSLWQTKKERENGALWLTLGFVLLAALALSLWQVRTAFITQSMAILPLSVLLARGGSAFSRFWQGFREESAQRTRRRAAILFFIIALGLFVRALEKKEIPADGGITPAKIASCDIQAAAQILNGIEGQETIAAYVIDGSELLFRTHHRVLAASYHRDAEGILAAHRILMADKDGTARELINRYDVGLILVCAENLPYWKRTSGSDHPFAQRLWDGAAPEWLNPLGTGPGFKIYQVRRSRFAFLD